MWKMKVMHVIFICERGSSGTSGFPLQGAIGVSDNGVSMESRYVAKWQLSL